MQGLVKAPSRIGKFIPHSTGAVVDRSTSQPESSLPILKTEPFDQLAHDARNVLSAMKLYCELLAEPGVLSAGCTHYAQELQAVSDTAAQLLERLAAPRRAVSHQSTAAKERRNLLQDASTQVGGAALNPDSGSDLGAELVGMRPLLAGIAGPRIALEIETLPSPGRTRLSKEDLIRVMLNLVRNASEAMPTGGRVRITAQYGDGLSFLDAAQIPEGYPRSVLIAIEDSGPGIPAELRERVFEAGFTTRDTVPSWPGVQHRGLGLTIVRDLIGEAGGIARVCSSPGGGGRFELELPVTSGTCEIANPSGLVADSAEKGCIECP